MIELILGFFFTLICGSYGFTALAYKWLSGKIDKQFETLTGNHIAHIEARLTKLEEKIDP
jgi:hypothetical protein